MGECIEEFRTAIRNAGLTPPEVIEPDGKLHRFASNGKRGDDAGWYVLHHDGIPAGAFGDWRTGRTETWRADIGRSLSPQEEAEHRARLATMKRERDAEDVRRRAEARQMAAAIWQTAIPAPDDHAYLLAKGVKAHGVRLCDGALLVPVQDGEQLHSLQFIAGDGGKRFLTGGRVSGCYFSIGKPDGVLCIAEGYATGASIHEATGYAVVVAFNAGNLRAVAEALRGIYPEVRIIVSGDNDATGTGQRAAHEAACAINGLVAIPAEAGRDWNDVRLAEGLGAVRAGIEAGSLPIVRDVDGAETGTDGAEHAQPDTAPLPSEDAQRAELHRLAKLSRIAYDQEREATARAFGIRAATLDAEVSALRRSAANDRGGVAVRTVDPWSDPVAGAEALHEALALIRGHVICDAHTAVAATLWCAMTYLVDSTDTLPLAIITAPERRCGKSRLLAAMGRLVQRPLPASNVSPAAIYRSIEKWTPTLLIDEADTFMRDNEELRGVINSGHTRDAAFVLRCVGDDFTPHQFSTWCPKVLSGIGSLPGTIEDRAVMLRLRRKLPSEQVAAFRDAGARFEHCAAKLARFAEDHAGSIRSARPALPNLGDDRAAENWYPLIAIAEVAGGDWPRLALEAAQTLTTAGERDTEGIGAMLLVDVRAIFAETAADRISTADLLTVSEVMQ
jgi:putative DNA primase/helicase